MLKHSLKTLSAGTVLALAATGAWAQTATTANPASTTIGVTPQDAREATQKAVPRADTGTLVRTDPSAADRASDMAKDAKDAVTPNTPNTPNTPSTSNTRSNTTAAPMGTTNRTATGNANPSEPRNSNTTTGTVNNTTTPSQAMGISGTLPGNAPTSGDATNTRNNPGSRATGTPMGTDTTDTNRMNDSPRANAPMNNANLTNRPARADRN